MASTWSALKIELLETGQNSGTWGTLTNVNLGDAVLGEAITGSATVDFPTDADVTVTLTDSATSQSARNLRLNITESSTGVGSVRSLILGSGCQIEKFYLINNTGTGAKTVKNTTGTGISVPAGKATLVYNNGTNVVDAATYFTSLTLGTALPVASGGTGLSAGTSGGVLAFTATGTLASSTALAANALVIGGGAGAAPSTTTTGTGVLTFLGTPSSANLAAAVTDETGTGALVFATSPTLVTPALGSPSSVGTMPAFTLGGTVSGGGNQINNVVIGTTTPLAGSFTTLTTSSTVTINGGTANGVAYLDGSKVLTTGTALTYDGTKLNVIGSASNQVNFSVTASSSDLFRVQPQASGTGVYLQVTDYAQTVYAPMGFYATAFTFNADATIYGVTVGRGAGAVASNTALGASALAVNQAGGTNNTAIGNAALDANTTGDGNTAVGDSALGANIAASGNTAVGYEAGLSNTTGANNVFIGAAAGRLAQTGSNATAVGYTAMYNPNTGADNSAFGHAALATNSSGAYNTAIGSAALTSNSTASENTAVGYQSLYTQTTASTGSNTALGYQAGYTTNGYYNTFLGYGSGRNTTGNENTWVGHAAGYSATTGGSNTGVGVSALQANTASSNTAMGTSALYTNTSGANNTALGAQSLNSNLSASNNTAVGYQAGYTNVTGASNTFVGDRAGKTTTGGLNTFVGALAGQNLTSGTKNTIIGAYDGNQDGLNIRTANSYVVLSDGDGLRQITMAEGYSLALDSAHPTIGTGITFPASDSPSTNANTLDDYEEGVWTPNQGSGLTVIGTFNSVGRYTKIGNLVTVNFQVSGTTSIACSSIGEITSNLPFSIAASPGNAMGSCMNSNNVNTGAYGFLTVIYSSTTALVAAGAILVTITYQV